MKVKPKLGLKLKKVGGICLLLLLLILLTLHYTHFFSDLSFEHLRSRHLEIQEFIWAHPLLSPLIFIGIYTLSVVFIIPDSTILSLFAGLFFPLPLAFFYCLFSETLGAFFCFQIVRFLGRSLNLQEYRFLHKVRRSLKKHEASYLLFLRLSHLLPFWLINVCAGYFSVRLWTFLWTTFVGILPLTYFLIQAGHSLQKSLALQQPFKFSSLFTPEIDLILLLLGLLTLLPIVYKKWKEKH